MRQSPPVFSLFMAGLIAAAPVYTADASSDSALHHPGGAVYAMTNGAEQNEIYVYDRGPHGRLCFSAAFETGGLGTDGDPAEIDPLGSQGSLRLSSDGRWLFAVNAGSDELSVFEVSGDGLRLADLVSSGGSFPSSVTSHGDLVYVLNAGGDANIVGFRLNDAGELAMLEGSSRSLDAGGTNPPVPTESPAEIRFTPDGKALVVTQKATSEIHVFPLDSEGRPELEPITTLSAGPVPFGFTFDGKGRLLVAEAGTNAVSSYKLEENGSLEVISASIPNFQTATCWLATDGRAYAYAINTGSSSISGYLVREDGSLSLLDKNGVTYRYANPGTLPTDVAISADGRFLYTLNGGVGSVGAFRINADGSLSSLGQARGLPAMAGIQGIAAW